MEGEDVYHKVELVAREAYGRLVATMMSRTRDLELAQDLLSQSLLAALESWPKQGIPEQPEAWLIAVAKRRHVDHVRHDHVAHRAKECLEAISLEIASKHSFALPLQDRRLELLFLCAHPSIQPQIRAPLMLQVVLGLNAQEIGRAFLVSPSTMGQRLARAKRKIRAANVPFTLPDEDYSERLAVVCEAIYGAFTTGFDEQSPSARQGLSAEAVWLARLVHQVSKERPETGGLLALMLYIESRRGARRGALGEYVPLEEQDPECWDRVMLKEAEVTLWKASRKGVRDRFQLEAAIQSVHVQGVFQGDVNWSALLFLYEQLLTMAPTLGAQVAYFAVAAKVHGERDVYEDLVVFGRSHDKKVQSHQAYWALRADLERCLELNASASATKAVSLSEDSAVRSFLMRKFGLVSY